MEKLENKIIIILLQNKVLIIKIRKKYNLIIYNVPYYDNVILILIKYNSKLKINI